ncbi:MAG: hypothetical protein JSV52_03605 [Candidatus Zixiibacteriota bacterium]|nr:MAG: hypothetical protein JSV52_03605 [candidate division Zixibacteria bacterium]
MKQLCLIFIVFLIATGTVFSQKAEGITWTNYFGIGGSIEVDNIPRDRTALHFHGAVCRRMLSHVQIALSAGYHPFGDKGTLVSFGDNFEIITLGLGGRINALSGSLKTNGYVLIDLGMTLLDSSYWESFHSLGLGVETGLGGRSTLFLQIQYFAIHDRLATMKFVYLSAGIGFSPG